MTSDLKIDGKKEITAQKERLLTCKERGIEGGGGICLCCAFTALPSSGLFGVHMFPKPEWVSPVQLSIKVYHH